MPTASLRDFCEALSIMADIIVPQPDPTLLTTAQLTREISNARELIESKVSGAVLMLEGRIAANASALETVRIMVDRHVDTTLRDLKEIAETRFVGMDRAIDLLQDIQNRVPMITDEKVNQLRSLHQEKFDSIAVQFAERDTRTEQTAAGVKIALDAALQAAKEAVAEQNRSFALATGKSETATMKQIDALGLAIQTANKGLDDKIADMKDKLTRIEGMDLGSNRHREQQLGERAATHGGNQNMIAIAAAILAALAIVLTFMHSSPVSVAPSSMLQRQSAPQFLPLPKFGLRVAGFEAPSRMISRTSTVIGYFDILDQFNFSIDTGRPAKSSYFEFGQDHVWPLGIQKAIAELFGCNGASGGCIGGYLGVVKAFTDVFQLDPKQYLLASANDYEPERKEPCCIVHHPTPQGFALLTVACLLGSIWGILLICLWLLLTMK